MLFNATIWRRENTMSDGAPYYYAVEPKKTGTHEVRRHIGDPTGTAKDKKNAAVSHQRFSRQPSTIAPQAIPSQRMYMYITAQPNAARAQALRSKTPQRAGTHSESQKKKVRGNTHRPTS